MGQRAWVIGNAAWDETLHVTALPRPGASMHIRRGRSGPGGKGLNQAAVLARAGVPTVLVAAIGADAAGEQLAALVVDEGIGGGLLLRDGLATDWSGILVAEVGENAVLTTRACAGSVRPDEVDAALRSAKPGDLLVLQGNLALEATEGAIVAARARGMRVALNPSPPGLAFAPLLARVDVLFLNRDEAQVFGSAEPEALRALGAPIAILTLGAEGACRVTAQSVEAVPAVPATSVDPTGAGDAFMATALAHALRRDRLPDRAALEAAAAAASLAVAREGAFAGLPSREALAPLIAAP